METLPLKPVVDVFYNLENIPAVRRGFNLGAIIGSSQIIPQQTRGIVFNSIDEMLNYGFQNNSPELLAAQIYFSATSNPSQVYIGRWVEQSTYSSNLYDGPITNGNIVTIGEQSYTIGDGTENTTTIDQLVEAAKTAGAQTATGTDNTLYLQFISNTPGSTGSVITLTIDQGSGGLVGKVISRVGEDSETLLEAVQACHKQNDTWYAFGLTSVVNNTDIQSLAAWAETTNNGSPITYFAHTNDAGVVNGSEDNLFSTLSALKYKRTIGTLSLQPYTHIGAMGYAMGQTSDLANSSYTLGLKELPGVLPDEFTSLQVNNIEKNNGNVYINRGLYYNMYESGKVFSGAWYDEIIQLDRLVNDIQLNIMDLLYNSPKLPQTEGGLAQILASIDGACQKAVRIGFIAPGQWTANPILNLNTNDYLPMGYLIQADSFESQSKADRAARKAPAIYLALKLAGSIQSVVVRIDVNR